MNLHNNEAGRKVAWAPYPLGKGRLGKGPKHSLPGPPVGKVCSKRADR